MRLDATIVLMLLIVLHVFSAPRFPQEQRAVFEVSLFEPLVATMTGFTDFFTCGCSAKCPVSENIPTGSSAILKLVGLSIGCFPRFEDKMDRDRRTISSSCLISPL
jgi:hypothetical protein